MKSQLSLHLPDCAHQDAYEIFHGGYDMPLPRPPATVLDIGGNVGLFSIWATKVWPEAKITAFEPWLENAADFRRNTDGMDNVDLVTAAVWREDVPLVIHAGRNRMCCTLETPTLQQLGEAHECQAIDAATLPAAEFIKIDVEGSELDILWRLDLSQALGVAVEVHQKDQARQIMALLRDAGLHIYSHEPTVNGCSLVKATRVQVRPEDRSAWQPRSIVDEQASLVPVPEDIHVFLAMPVYGGFHPFFVSSLLKLMANKPCPITLQMCIGDSLVSRARNKLVAQFLASRCTHLLFLDTDLVFEPEAIARLISHQEDITAGLYPKKQRSLAWVMNTLPDETEDDRGLLHVKAAGTGCLLIARSVFERMIEAHPEIEYGLDDSQGEGTQWDFFATGPHTEAGGDRRRYLSEDWFFCRRALDLGIDVHMDTHIVLKHVGDCVYPLEDPFVPVAAVVG